MLKACFIGHSKVFQEGLGQKVYHQVITLAKEGVQEFYTGNKGDFDAVGIHAVAEAKKEFPNLKLYWPAAYYSEVQHWKEYKHQAIDQVLFEDCCALAYPKAAYTIRNRWMIDFCDFVISYVTVPFGGAFQALKYAENQKKKIFYLGG